MKPGDDNRNILDFLRSRLDASRAVGRLARVQRDGESAPLPAVVAFLPLDQRTRTSPVTATAALMAAALIDHPLVVVDVDGTSQPMRKLLASSGAGDIVGLAASHDASLWRRSVEDFVDMSARVPLASCWVDGPGAVPPDALRAATWKLRRRFPTVFLDVPIGCPRSTITAATALASHIVLVADKHDYQHDWLHTSESVLADAARRGAVTVAVVGGGEADRTGCAHDDTVPVPQLQVAGHSSEGIELPIADTAALTRCYELTSRVLRARGSVSPAMS